MSDEVVGTYQLQRVNNAPLPYIVTSPATTYVGGELEFTDDGRFDRTYQVASASGPSDVHVFGEWERIGSAIRLQQTDGRVIWAEFREDDGAIIIHDENEADWRYER